MESVSLIQFFADLPEESAGNRAFGIIGDTQKTMFGERLLFCEKNDQERISLVGALAREDLAFVVHLGDMVSAGYNSFQWGEFDRLFSPFIERGTPVLPAVGNHDYWGSAAKGMFHMESRFPQIRRCRWYHRVYNDMGFLWLDSNRKILGKYLWKEQLTWFEKTLKEMQSDSKIRGILVFTHHPPFSNSLITGDNHRIQWEVVPLVAATPKALGLFSGHAHGYERFFMQDKTYVVSGGGGGPRQPFRQGRAQKHLDQFKMRGPRPFHYIVVNSQSDHFHFVVKGLDKGESQIRVIEEFSIQKSIAGPP